MGEGGGSFGRGGGVFLSPQPSFLSLNGANSCPPDGRGSLEPGLLRGGGLRHSQLLSQVVEAGDVVHAALTHHTGQLRVHFCHIWKATGLKGIVRVAVQEAGSEQSRATGGAGGGEGGPLALIRRDHAGEEASQRGVRRVAGVPLGVVAGRWDPASGRADGGGRRQQFGAVVVAQLSGREAGLLACTVVGRVDGELDEGVADVCVRFSRSLFRGAGERDVQQRGHAGGSEERVRTPARSGGR